MRDSESIEIPHEAVTDRNMLYAAELNDLLRAMRDGAPVRVGLSDGIDTLRMIDAARRSAAAGQPVILSEAA
jgi:predicted dehydrogenase